MYERKELACVVSPEKASPIAIKGAHDVGTFVSRTKTGTVLLRNVRDITRVSIYPDSDVSHRRCRSDFHRL